MPALNSLQELLFKSVKSDSKEEFVSLVNNLSETIDWSGALGPEFRVLLPVYLEAKELSPEFKIAQESEKAIKSRYIYNFAKNLKTRQTIFELANEFNKEKIDYSFLKGSALILTVYDSDIGRRIMADIDILVGKNDLAKAENALKKLGFIEDYSKFAPIWSRDYASKHHFHYFYSRNDVYVELHWNIDYYRNDGLLSNILGHKEIVKTEGLEIGIPDAGGNIFFASNNFLNDLPAVVYDNRHKRREVESSILFGCCLFFFYELKKILSFYRNKIDWNNFFYLAKSSQKGFEILLLLFLAKEFFNAGVPRSVIEKIRSNKWVRLYLFLFAGLKRDDLLATMRLLGKFLDFHNKCSIILHPPLLIRKLSCKFGRKNS